MKYYSKFTRDFTRTINLGPLVVSGLASGEGQEVLPPRVHVLESKAGQIAVWRTKKARDAYIAAINAEAPGAAIPCEA